MSESCVAHGRAILAPSLPECGWMGRYLTSPGVKLSKSLRFGNSKSDQAQTIADILKQSVGSTAGERFDWFIHTLATSYLDRKLSECTWVSFCMLNLL